MFLKQAAAPPTPSGIERVERRLGLDAVARAALPHSPMQLPGDARQPHGSPAPLSPLSGDPYAAVTWPLVPPPPPPGLPPQASPPSQDAAVDEASDEFDAYSDGGSERSAGSTGRKSPGVADSDGGRPLWDSAAAPLSKEPPLPPPTRPPPRPPVEAHNGGLWSLREGGSDEEGEEEDSAEAVRRQLRALDDSMAQWVGASGGGGQDDAGAALFRRRLLTRVFAAIRTWVGETSRGGAAQRVSGSLTHGRAVVCVYACAAGATVRRRATHRARGARAAQGGASRASPLLLFLTLMLIASAGHGGAAGGGGAATRGG